MEGPEALSVSQISPYLTCSLKYRFQYIDRLPRLTRPAPVALGSSVHAALEWLHKEHKAGRNPTLEQLQRVFEADLYAQNLESPGDEGDDSPNGLLLKGKQLLGLYFHAPARPVREAELAFQVPLVDSVSGEALPVPLRGVIDLIEADDTVVELKTSLRRWSPADLPDNLQLTAYSYAYQVLFGRPPRELRLVNLVRTKTPAMETHTSSRAPADHDRLVHISKEVLKGIRGSVFVPNRGCWLCRDCEYDQDCREWTGNE